MAVTTDGIARVFGMLESINFAKMRDEFASASTEKMLAGENALEAALKILAQFVPPAGCRKWGTVSHSSLYASSPRSGDGSAFG